MAIYQVTKKNAAAFSDEKGVYPVKDGRVELPDNCQLVADLSAEGVIVALPPEPLAEEPPAEVAPAPAKSKKAKAAAEEPPAEG